MTLGVLALIAAAAAFYVLRRRRKMSTRRTVTVNPHLDPQNFATPYSNAPVDATSKAGRSEMPGDERVHEKDSMPVASRTIGELEAPRY